MKIHEYQAREILERYTLPVPKGFVAETPAMAQRAAREIGHYWLAVKAQVHAGGRGRAGGVALVKSEQELLSAASRILGMELKTAQMAGGSIKVHQVLVTEQVPIAKELYLAITLDRERGLPCAIFSASGGMDIEELAKKSPEKIIAVHFEPSTGLAAFRARDLIFSQGFEAATALELAQIVEKLVRIFVDMDCSLVEVNPLVITKEGKAVLLDAKISFDDNGLFRHPEFIGLRDEKQEDARELEAAEHGLSYVGLDGNIGCMVNGAGLAMATMDLIKLAGGEPANFLDVGGSATAGKVTSAFKIILRDSKVQAVLVNIFGGIMKCDIIAQGILDALREVKISVPLVVRLEGTNVETGREILKHSGIAIITANDLKDAAEKVVGQLGGRRQQTSVIPRAPQRVRRGGIAGIECLGFSDNAKVTGLLYSRL
ncbi:MAG: ADP-forming succinate--CoA ligase subunit beta [Candidatus Omnitrophica bacterium]|nr:ADP-forming succinate--CoA ligase subunit beta [Candidatus Omnitrophota bacterium]